MNKQIPEVDVHVWWKNTCSTRIVSFKEFKENLKKTGYTITKEKLLYDICRRRKKTCG